LYPREFGPFYKENSLLLQKVIFFTMELFLLHGELAWEWHLVFFFLGRLLPKRQLIFKIYLNVLSI
jgi:hypothetical protein